MSNLKTNAYMDDTEASIAFKNLSSLKHIYILDYLMYLNFINLYDENCIIDNKYSSGEFFDNILAKGYIPYLLNR